MRLVLNTIQGSEAEFMAANGRIIQTGIVSEIPASADSDASVLIAALSVNGMPKLGFDRYPGTTLVFVRLLIRGFTNDGVVIALYYESPQGIIPTAYIINDDSTMASRLMTFDPFTLQLLAVSYKGSASSDASQLGLGASVASIPALEDVLCPTEILMPCRELSITMISVGQPQIKGRGLFGGVNDDDWPGAQDAGLFAPLGGNPLFTTPPPVGDPLKKGYWLFNRMKSAWTKYQNYFQIDIGAIATPDFPWSQLLVARDPSTGLYVKPDKSVLKGALTAAFSEYKPGFGDQTGMDAKGNAIYENQYNNDGFSIWGPYRLVSFKDTFGF